MVRLLLFAGLTALPSLGNGILRWGFGAEDLGAAGAFGLTRGNSIAAIQGNPALLTTLKDEVAFSGRLLVGEGDFRRGDARSGLTDGVGAYPDFAISRQVGSFTLGLGLSPIAAVEAKWNFLDAPGGRGGISYGTLAHKSRYAAVRLSAGLGWQVSDTWSLGLTAGVIRSELIFDAPFIFQTNPALANAKVDLDLETDDWAPAFTFGALYQPNEAWTFGLLVTPPVSFDHRGRARANFSAQFPSLADPLTKYQARARNELPLSISLGSSWQVNEKLSLGVKTDWHQWSQSYDRLRIDLSGGNNAEINREIGSDPSDEVPIAWRDRFVFSVGAEYELSPEWTLRGGWRYGKSPIPDELVTPLNGAILEQALTLGLGWQRGHWQVDAAWAYEFGPSVSVGTSGYNAGEYSNSSLDFEVHHLSIGVRRSF